jgi:hypothetical protein
MRAGTQVRAAADIAHHHAAALCTPLLLPVVQPVRDQAPADADEALTSDHFFACMHQMTPASDSNTEQARPRSKDMHIIACAAITHASAHDADQHAAAARCSAQAHVSTANWQWCTPRLHNKTPAATAWCSACDAACPAAAAAVLLAAAQGLSNQQL